MKARLLGAGLILAAVGIAILAVPLLQLAFPADRDASVQSVVIRNSLLASVGSSADFAWTPMSIPTTYLQEFRTPPALFAQAAEDLFSETDERITAFERALVIGRHLGSGPDRGGAIMSSVEHTYKTIINDGGGYCSDYTQTFNALAMASGLSVREWGIAFDEFGAGHAFNEIYEPSANKWMLIDSFWSLYVRDKASGIPLSALEFQSALRGERDPDSIEFVPIIDDRFGFKSPEDALDYYRQAEDQFFLWWGNNVWSYDAHPIVAWSAKLSRSLEQLSAIAFGVHPQIKIVQTADNQELIDNFLDKRSELVIRISGILVLSLVFLGLSIALFRRWRNLRRTKSL